mmetsp:Transcript_22973/g.63953  ORF Transcript_22973/g.63953 Transcript_22973/m.63953 type:complete len:224 (-) Transcript_22973:1036-1707(-)
MVPVVLYPIRDSSFCLSSHSAIWYQQQQQPQHGQQQSWNNHQHRTILAAPKKHSQQRELSHHARAVQIHKHKTVASSLFFRYHGMIQNRVGHCESVSPTHVAWNSSPLPTTYIRFICDIMSATATAGSSTVLTRPRSNKTISGSRTVSALVPFRFFGGDRMPRCRSARSSCLSPFEANFSMAVFTPAHCSSARHPSFRSSGRKYCIIKAGRPQRVATRATLSP